MLKKYKYPLFFIVFSIITSTAFAQDPGPDPGEDPDAPIDGGIALLAAGAAAYGIKTLRKNKQEKAEE